MSKNIVIQEGGVGQQFTTDNFYTRMSNLTGQANQKGAIEHGDL